MIIIVWLFTAFISLNVFFRIVKSGCLFSSSLPPSELAYKETDLCDICIVRQCKPDDFFTRNMRRRLHRDR